MGSAVPSCVLSMCSWGWNEIVQLLLFVRPRPYHVGNTGSRLITEVKQRRARLVLAWVTGWEYRVLRPFLFTTLACLFACCHWHNTSDQNIYNGLHVHITFFFFSSIYHDHQSQAFILPCIVRYPFCTHFLTTNETISMQMHRKTNTRTRRARERENEID